MSWSLCTSGAAIYKAGANANSDIRISGAILANWSDESEGQINTITRKDWITNTPNVNFTGILSDLVSDMIATKIISYDMSGYTSRLEAQTMLDVLNNNINRNLKALTDEKNKEVMD